MKKTGFTRKIIALLAVAAIGFTALAGCGSDEGKCIDGGEHVMKWTVDKEATCTSEGLRTGKCVNNCGYITQEVIPIDSNAHAYGEWEIVTMPTQTETGLARKRCTLNEEHTPLDVELPVYTLTGKGEYSEYEMIKQPTAAVNGEGKLHLVLAHEQGDISFDVTLPRRGIETLEDAIMYATSLGGNIRSSEGYYTESAPDSSVNDQGKPVEIGAQMPFEVYFGDDYVRVREWADLTESWYSLDESGKIFGVTMQIDEDGTAISDPVRDAGATEQNMNGFSYQSGGGDKRTYGAEDLLLNAYTNYISPEAVIKGCDPYEAGDRAISFWFSIYEQPYYVRYRIVANLFETGEIQSVTQYTNIIHPYMIEEDPYTHDKLFTQEGDVVWAPVYLMSGGDYVYKRENGEILYELDEEGNQILDVNGNPIPIKLYEYETDEQGNPIYMTDEQTGEFLYDCYGDPIPKPIYYSDESEAVNNREIYFSQVLKKPDEVVPENPYSSEERFMTDYDLMYDGQIVGEDPISIPSNERIILSLQNVVPAYGIDYDNIIPYLREPVEGGGYRDVPLTMDFGDNAYGVMGFYQVRVSGNTKIPEVTLRVQYAGDICIVLKTTGGKVEKIVNLNVQKGAPSSEFPLIAQYYAYSEAGGKVVYNWLDCPALTTDGTGGIVVFENQPLIIRGTTVAAGLDFVDTSCVASRFIYSYDEDTGRYSLIQGNEVVSQSNPDGTITFTGKVAGKYVLRVDSALDSNIYVDFLVEVKPAPSIPSMFRNGTEYSGQFENIRLGSSADSSEADVTVKVVNNGSYANGTLEIDVEGNKSVYSYTVTNVDGKYVLNAQYVSGVSPTDNLGTFDFTFAINEAYSITITHPTSFGTITETIVISPV